MKRRMEGSYTVETAFVMALVLWAVLFSIQAAYRLRDETVGAMALHGAAEYLRHGEERTAEEAEAYAKRLAGRPFSWSGYKFSIEQTDTVLRGRRIRASGNGGTWSLKISQSEYSLLLCAATILVTASCYSFSYLWPCRSGPRIMRQGHSSSRTAWILPRNTQNPQLL